MKVISAALNVLTLIMTSTLALIMTSTLTLIMTSTLTLIMTSTLALILTMWSWSASADTPQNFMTGFNYECIVQKLDSHGKATLYFSTVRDIGEYSIRLKEEETH